MFEDSLLMSGDSFGGRSRWARWTVLVSVAVQGLTVAAFIAVPMIWPDTLPKLHLAPKMTSIMLNRPPQVKPQPVKPQVVPVTSQAAMRAPSTAAPMVESRHGGSITNLPSETGTDAPSLLPTGLGMGGPFVPGVGPGIGTGNGPTVVAAVPAGAKTGEPLKVSSGVSAGLLLQPIVPVYPRIAVAAHVEGTVIVTAIIDKKGRITGLQVVSGPPMLRAAAADAIREARYRPYLLSGEPTEVVTTISVTFRMNG